MLMTARPEQPASPLTPSRVQTPPESMADPAEELAWDDVAEALDLSMLFDLTSKPEDDIFSPLDLSNVPPPELKPTRVATRPPAQPGSAPVAAAKRPPRAKPAPRKGTRRVKREKKVTEKPPHIVDGEVDSFPRLKTVTPIEEPCPPEAGFFGQNEGQNRGDGQLPETDPFISRDDAGPQQPPKGFHNSATPQQFNWRNYSPFPGMHYGFLLPPANQQDFRNRSWPLDMDQGRPHNWLPPVPQMFEQQSFPYQFPGMSPWYRNAPFLQHELYQQTQAHQNTNQSQYSPLPCHPDPPAPRSQAARAPRRSRFAPAPKPAARETQQVPSMIYEALRRKKEMLASLQEAENRASVPASDTKLVSAVPLTSVARHGHPDGALQPAAKTVRNRRPVPDLDLLKRTLENIKKTNAAKPRPHNRRRNTTQARKTSNQQCDKLPQANGPCSIPDIPKDESEITPTMQGDQLQHRLTALGGIRKPANIKPTARVRNTRKLNHDWRSSAPEEHVGVHDQWAQLRAGMQQADRRRLQETENYGALDYIGQGRNYANVGHGCGYSRPNINNRQHGSVRSVFERLGHR